MTYISNILNQYNTYCNIVAALMGVVMAILLGGCDLHEPTSFHEKRLAVYENNYAKIYDSKTVSARTIYDIVENYERYGDGQMNITVTYDPSSKDNSSFTAVEHLGAVTASLRELGIYDVKGGVMPIHDQGVSSQTLVAYRSYSAVMPDCKQIPGLNDRKPDTSADYEFGCSTETLMAKQVYRPKDLLGNSALGRSDGRRAANVMDTYRSGEPAEALDAETITE